MPRPKRTRKLREGTAVYIPERCIDMRSTRFVELYANNLAYKGDQVCIGLGSGSAVDEVVQTTIRDLEDAIKKFKELRGIKRVSRKTT